MKFKYLIFLIILFLFTNPASAFAATLSLSPSTGTYNRGCNFSLNVELDAAGAQTDGTDAILKYDPIKVTGISITNGSIYPDYPGNSIDTQSGKINISGITPDAAFSSKGILATINFKVTQNAPVGDTPITFDFDASNKAKTTDSNVVERGTIIDVLSSVTNGNYTIGTGVCGSTSTSTTQTSTTGSTSSTGTGGSLGTLTSGSQGAVGVSTPAGQLKDLSPGGVTPGLTTPTLVLTISGVILVLLGILGLAFL